jgi:exopolysaccharide production protein ExoY
MLKGKNYEPICRLMDIILSLIFIFIFSPVYIIVAFLIYKEDRYNPVYFQTRIGLNKQPFKFYKFRSMVANADDIIKKDLELYNKLRSGNNKAVDDPRITKIGKFIRKYSIDEFPQMFNVLKGDMSIVGPRALRPDEFKLYEEKDSLNIKKMEVITSVKPGLTGYWQVGGRSDVDFETRMGMDMYYARNKSLLFDIKIMLKTPMAIVGAKGSY